MLIFWISDRDGGNGTLIKVVYRDGKSLGSSLWQIRWILDIGIIYYLYLFGRSQAGNELLVSASVIPFPSSDWKVTSFVDTHVGTCHPTRTVWAILIFKAVSSVHIILSILDRDGGNASLLMTVVYRDGKPLTHCYLVDPTSAKFGT